MPRPKIASSKRSRALARCDNPLLNISKQMHLPQIEAAGFLDALVLMGHGMRELGRDEADAVLALAQAARERLKLLDDGFIDLIQAASMGSD